MHFLWNIFFQRELLGTVGITVQTWRMRKSPSEGAQQVEDICL